MHKEDEIYTHSRIIFSHRKKQKCHLQRCEQTQRLSYTVKCQKNKYHIIQLICGIQKNDTGEFTCKAETETQRQRTNVWIPWEGGGWWDELVDWNWHRYTTNIMNKLD